MTREPNGQSSLGGVIFTLLALLVALAVVVWLVADTPFDGGSNAATDPPPYTQMSDPSGATVKVAPDAGSAPSAPNGG